MQRSLFGGRRGLCRLLGAACASVTLCGCSGWWDEITSRDFQVKNMFVKENPYIVLQETKEGDKRAKAIRALKEPKLNGGKDKEQDAVMHILEAAATEDKLALCRLAAIEKLGQMQDTRAVPSLVKGFYAAKGAKLFAPEMVNIIECQALESLGQTKNPAAVEHLVLVVREPPPAADLSPKEKQYSLDRRTAAARALGNYNHYQAVDALVRVLETEKDVALRDRAHQSLQLATGKKLPPDAKKWHEFLEQSPEENQAAGGILGKMKNPIQPAKFTPKTEEQK